MIAAVIPAFNEAKNIQEVVRRTKKYVDEIIVVDDGSSDNTYELTKRSGATVIRHEKNKGKGEALNTGIKYLKNKKFDYIVIIDADLQFYPEDAPKIISALKTYDFVMGSRNMKTLPFRHKLGNFVWKTAFNLFYGTHLTDTNSGFVGFKGSVAGKLNFGGGYIIETCMLDSAVRNKMKLANVPVRVEYHHSSGVGRGIRMVVGILFYIIRKGVNYRFGI